MRLSLGLIALAACSPVVAHTPDGHTADSSPDTPTHGMVTVKVFDVNNPGAVVVGVPVAFVEADGTQVGHPVTGTDGVASADVHAGASASVVIAGANNTQIQTLFGLQPGDNIILGPELAASTQVGTFSVTFPAYGSATSYSVYGPCGYNSGTPMAPTVLTMYSDCKLDTMDITVVPLDASGTGLAFLTKSNVAFVSGGSTVVTGSYTVMSPFTATLTNLNAIITNANVTRYVPDNYGFSNNASGTPAMGTLSVSTPGPVAAKALVSTSLSTANSSQLVMQGLAGNVQTYGFDATMTLLPWVNKPTFDVANHKIMISTDTTGTTTDTPDVVFSQVAYSRTVGTTTTSFNWLAVGATATDMTLPLLPVDVGDVMPKSTDTINGVVAAEVEADTLNGFGDVRLDLYKSINSVTNAPHPTAMKVRESLANTSGR